jgi:lipid-binding SYLF domain-containing protein
MAMSFRFVLILAWLVTLTGCTSAPPRDIQAMALVDSAKATIETYKARPSDDGRLFQAALRDAKGVMIFPDVFEGGAGIGGSGGTGVMLVRQSNGQWGYPAFYRIGGFSLGLQLGVQSSQVIFVMMTDGAVRAVIASPAQFGIGAAATFGELSGSGSSATTLRGADIIGFTKSTGVYLGAALSSAYVSAQNDLNGAFYGSQPITSSEILLNNKHSNPEADRLRQALVVQ